MLIKEKGLRRGACFRMPHNLLAWAHRVGKCGLQSPYGAEGIQRRALTESSSVVSYTAKGNTPPAFFFLKKLTTGFTHVQRKIFHLR